MHDLVITNGMIVDGTGAPPYVGDLAIDGSARNEPATSDHIAAMATIVRDAIDAGALGFSTSRTLVHKAVDGFTATIVSGQVIMRNGIETGARPGPLVPSK